MANINEEENKVTFISDYKNEERIKNLSDTNKLYNVTYEEILRLANFAERQRDLVEEVNNDELDKKLSNIIEKKIELIDELKELKDFLTTDES